MGFGDAAYSTYTGSLCVQHDVEDRYERIEDMPILATLDPYTLNPPISCRFYLPIES